MHTSIRTLTVVATATVLPYVITWALGCYWLFERGFLLPYLGVTAAITLIGWRTAHSIAKMREAKANPPPPNNWPAAGESAWQAIDKLAHETEANPPPFALNQVGPLLQKTFETVAVHFHPKSNQPAFEVTLPDALRCIEYVAHDLRQEVESRLPGSHAITLNNLNDVTKFSPLLKIIPSLYECHRMIAFSFNPLAGMVREASAPASLGMLNLTQDALQRWALGFCVRRSGRYAINLYSGQLALDAPEFAALGEDKPLQILVLGQTKAGKSSLINALFGQELAATDVLPCTDTITSYVLKRDGLPKAIVYDTVGFAGTGDESARSKLDEEIGRCDLVLVVSSAMTAAREADRKLLDEATVRLKARTRQSIPPTVVALTHIDLLRPIHEWHPPYDFDKDDSPKVRNIRDAMQAVAEDLNVSRDCVVPVCLRAGGIYNVEEQLLPAIAVVLPEAQRAKLLRLLMDARSETQREALKQQLMKAGLTLAQAGFEIIRFGFNKLNK